MKFTDLNIDCMETILEHLKFTDLLNAANANIRIRRTALSLIPTKYGLGTAAIANNHRYFPYKLETYWPKNNLEFRFDDIERCLQFFACFGPFLTRIELNISNEKITSYINKYCADSLVEIEFRPEAKVHLLNKPFTKLESVCFNVNSTELLQKDGLNRLFPNVRKLEVRTSNCYLFHSGDMAEHFPLLERLIVIHRVQWFDCTVCRQNMINFFQLNPQLNYLHIELNGLTDIVLQGRADFSMLHTVKESLQNLETLILDGDYDFFWHMYHFETIHLKSVKHFKLSLTDIGTIDIPFQLDNLNKFSFYGRFDTAIHQFVKQHPMIKKLNTYFSCADSFEEIAEKLPVVTDIGLYIISDDFPHINNYNLYDLNRFLNKFKSLKVFTVKMEKLPLPQIYPFDFPEIITYFANNWIVVTHDEDDICEFLTMRRK